VPILFAEFTNWHPVPMTSIMDYVLLYCEGVTEPKIIHNMLWDGRISEEQRTFKDLQPGHQKLYHEYVEMFKRDLANSWKEVMAKNCRYRKPHFANTESTKGDAYKKLYLLPRILRTGMHPFIV